MGMSNIAFQTTQNPPMMQPPMGAQVKPLPAGMNVMGMAQPEQPVKHNPFSGPAPASKSNVRNNALLTC